MLDFLKVLMLLFCCFTDLVLSLQRVGKRLIEVLPSAVAPHLDRNYLLASYHAMNRKQKQC